jgi:hypothetical protein
MRAAEFKPTLPPFYGTAAGRETLYPAVGQQPERNSRPAC